LSSPSSPSLLASVAQDDALGTVLSLGGQMGLHIPGYLSQASAARAAAAAGVVCTTPADQAGYPAAAETSLAAGAFDVAFAAGCAAGYVGWPVARVCSTSVVAGSSREYRLSGCAEGQPAAWHEAGLPRTGACLAHGGAGSLGGEAQGSLEACVATCTAHAACNFVSYCPASDAACAGGSNGCPAEFAFLSEIASHGPDPQICYSQADFAQGATNTGCGSWCCKDGSCSAGCNVQACADFAPPASNANKCARYADCAASTPGSGPVGWVQSSATQGCSDYLNGGVILQNADSPDIASCKTECAATPGCRYLTFYATTTWCSLFTTCALVWAGARPHCCFAPPLIQFTPDSLTHSVPPSLKRYCGRTPPRRTTRTPPRPSSSRPRRTPASRATTPASPRTAARSGRCACGCGPAAWARAGRSS
jgi:hypothetical protein